MVAVLNVARNLKTLKPKEWKRMMKEMAFLLETALTKGKSQIDRVTKGIEAIQTPMKMNLTRTKKKTSMGLSYLITMWRWMTTLTFRLTLIQIQMLVTGVILLLGDVNENEPQAGYLGINLTHLPVRQMTMKEMRAHSLVLALVQGQT